MNLLMARAIRESPLRGVLPLGFALFVLCVACSRGGSSGPVDRSAHEFDGSECAACGMIVREQPSPRAQAVHRDGERAFFCSVGEALTYLGIPSPHGAIVATYVEVMAADADPATDATERRPWLAAERASYVRGVVRPRVMGEAVLTYAAREDAARAATRFGGHVATWSQLKSGDARETEN